MDNRANHMNACIDNMSFNVTNSFTHLLEEENNSMPIKLSEYVDVDAFAKQLHGSKSKLSMVSLNVQSIRAKFDELKITIDQINQQHYISVICLQETWLSSEDDTSIYELDNYQLISKGHSCSAHGGLMIYVHNDFNFTVKQTGIITNVNEQVIPNWEHMFISITHKMQNSKTYIIGNIYPLKLLIPVTNSQKSYQIF